MSSFDSVDMRSWAQLPKPALLIAFSKLKLSERAGTVDCVARVCSSCADAAAAATVSIDLDSCRDPDSLQQWLRSRGFGAHMVQIKTSTGVITALPCPKLQRLLLHNSSVDLRPGSQLLQDLSAATGLTTLVFDQVTFQGEPDLARLVSALPSLLQLYLTWIKVKDTPQPAVSPAQASHAGPQPFWSAADGYRRLSDAGMRFLCTVTQLKGLQLDHMQAVKAASLVGLQNLTGLEALGMWHLSREVTLSAVPGFSRLTGLTTLTLIWDTHNQDAHNQFDPSVLAHMMQLKHLRLARCTPAGGAELLNCLAHLHQLEELTLWEVARLEECDPALLWNVTGSSSLRSLVLWGLWDQPGLWQHVLLDSRQLLQLGRLLTNFPFGALDLNRVVSSCSQLQQLCLCCAAGLQLTTLLQLKQLTSVWLVDVADNSSVASVAQLSGLQGLKRMAITAWPQDRFIISNDIVASLTALTQLTHLALPRVDGFYTAAMEQQLQRCYKGPFTEGPLFMDIPWRGFHCFVITDTAPAGAPPDVWSQLLSCCEDCSRATQHNSQVAVGASLGVRLRQGLKQHREGISLVQLIVIFIGLELWACQHNSQGCHIPLLSQVSFGASPGVQRHQDRQPDWADWGLIVMVILTYALQFYMGT